MSDLTTEARLALIRQVRASYDRNMYDMTNREKLLYGRQTIHPYDRSVRQSQNGYPNAYDDNPYRGYLEETADQASFETGGISFFKVRLIAGILLFFLLFAMDSWKLELAGHTAGEIFDAIACDYVDYFDELLAGISSQGSI